MDDYELADHGIPVEALICYDVYCYNMRITHFLSLGVCVVSPVILFVILETVEMCNYYLIKISSPFYEYHT